jgi:COP9 signalosome complex subunit 2
VASSWPPRRAASLTTTSLARSLARSPAQEEVQTENKYYSSKALIEAEKYAEALAGFLEIVDSGEEGKEWHFKALKQVVKIKVLSKDADVTDYFKRFLEASTVVTRNAAEKKINSLLDYVSSKDGTNNELLEQFYTSTLQGLADAKNDRLYFKTSVKLAHLYLASGQEDKAMKVVDELLVKTEEGGQRLEVYALQIELLGSRGDRSNNALLQATYRKALAITSAIPHPRVLGVIREYGGKMHMYEKNWEEAATDFFESFKCVIVLLVGLVGFASPDRHRWRSRFARLTTLDARPTHCTGPTTRPVARTGVTVSSIWCWPT